MKLRLFVAGVVAALLVPLGGASAQEALDAGEVDGAGYPTLGLVVSTPDELSPDAVVTVTEDGVDLTPAVEPLAGNQLEVVLVIDTSGSMRGEALAQAKDAAQEFLGVLPARARVAVVGFGAEPTTATELTSDRAVVADAIDGLTAGGETALYDAVVVAGFRLVQSSPDARTALVVLSDGGDTVSTTTLEESAVVAGENFDVVHAVSLVTGEQDNTALSELVAGGGAVAEVRDPDALSSVYADVGGRIVNQYRLTWETTLVDDGEIAVALSDGTYVASTTRAVDVDESLVPPAPTVAATPTTPVAPVLTEPQPVDNPDTISGWTLLFGVVALAIGLFVAGLLLFGPRERTRHLASEFRQRVPRGREMTGAGRRVVDGVERWLRRDPDRRAGLALRLDRAGLDLAPAEFGAIAVTGAAVLALFGFALWGLIGLLLLPLVGGLLLFTYVDHRAEKRSRLFTAQLDSTLQLISGSLRSGFGIMQALGTVAEEAEWPTSEEFTRVIGEVRLGRDLGDALESSALRVNSEDYEWVVQAIDISREIGGNLSEVLDNVSGTIRQRNTLRREVRSLSAEGRISAYILFGLPFAMLIWMRLTNPEYVNLLFERSGGRVAIVGGVLLMTAGALWMRKIVQIRF